MNVDLDFLFFFVVCVAVELELEEDEDVSELDEGVGDGAFMGLVFSFGLLLPLGFKFNQTSGSAMSVRI